MKSYMYFFFYVFLHFFMQFKSQRFAVCKRSASRVSLFHLGLLEKTLFSPYQAVMSKMTFDFHLVKPSISCILSVWCSSELVAAKHMAVRG